jgi:acyl carrier protein
MVTATLDEVRRVIARVARCSQDEISLETALKDIKADSLHWVQIIIGVENAFDIEIDIERMKELTSIDGFVKYIDSCLE